MDGMNWRELYRDALLELDLDKLQERIKAAEEAILMRALRSMAKSLATNESPYKMLVMRWTT
jgi:hypothetical protein